MLSGVSRHCSDSVNHKLPQLSLIQDIQVFLLNTYSIKICCVQERINLHLINMRLMLGT